MSTSNTGYTCARGHRWELDESNAGIAAESLHCPVCGEASATLISGDFATSEIAVGDALPPPPGTALRLPKGGSDVVPASNELLELLSAPQQPNEIGRLGGYRVLRVLGEGGMGIVYEAEDPRLSRRVALKVIRPGFAATRSARSRFLQEARAAACLEHDHVVTVFEVGEERGIPFLAMQLLRGESLRQRLDREETLPVAEVLRIGRETAAGLAEAHAHHLHHRDIKPDNVWLEKKGQGPDGSALTPARVKILDFGLARSEHEDLHLTQTGAIIGTLYYMAPEQAAGAGVDHRCDLYSLGCLMYRMATGRLPVLGTSAAGVILSLTQDTPPAPNALNPTVPAAVSALLMKLLEKNPAARYQTANEVVAAIEDIERTLNSGQSASTPPAAPKATPPVPAMNTQTTRGRRFGSGGPGGRRVAMAAAGFVLVLGAVAILSTGEGTLRVKVTEADAEVLVDGDRKIQIDSKRLGKIELSPGRHELVVRRGEETLHTQKFTLWRGRDLLLEASWEPTKPNASAPAAAGQAQAAQAPAGAAADGLPDEKRLQGKWVPISGHMKGQPLTPEQLARLSIKFDGDRVEVVPSDAPSEPNLATFEIVPVRDPKHIDFISPDGKKRMPGIYGFEGGRLKLAIVDHEYARPTDFSPHGAADYLMATFERASLAELGPVEREVVKAGEAFLAVLDEGKFSESRNIMATIAKQRMTPDQLSQLWQFLRDTFGKANQRTLQKVQLYDQFPGLPAGPYAGVQYKTDFQLRKGLWEFLLLNVDSDGQWRVNSYGCTLQPVPLPEPAKKPNSQETQATAMRVLDRWVGQWELSLSEKPTKASPQAVTRTGLLSSSRILDDQFLYNHWKSDDLELLWLLTHDANQQAYRFWTFGSDGGGFERQGQWDEAARTLTIHIVPPGPGITGASIDRFLDDNTLERTLVVRNAAGEIVREVGGRAVRKSQSPVEIVPAEPVISHAPELAELSALNKLVGEWTIREVLKPSAWMPEGGERTTQEIVAWKLGGRFLQGIAFDEQKRMTSLWLMTHDPAQGGYAFWIFMADGTSGQWRVTWDEPAQTFTWKATDMPAGQIGTGLNQIVDADTIRGELVIKDGQGKVLHESTLTKRRAAPRVQDASSDRRAAESRGPV